MEVPTLILDLPLPPRATHPNARPHHMAKASATASQREAAMLTAIAARNLGQYKSPFKKPIVEAHFVVQGQHDTPNLGMWLKATLDGLQDAKVVLNDRDLTLMPPTQEVAKGKKNWGRLGVRLTIKEGA